MSVPAPHYLLYSASAPAAASGAPGDWRFVLEAVDGSAKVEIADSEPDIRGERLELLAVVRGLEALEQPSRVTLVTPSRYVNRGISYGLNDWRENGWQWERHGEMVPVKNHDLWQRIDRALEFHRVECRQWRLDGAHEPPGGQGTRADANASVHHADAPTSVSRFAFEPETRLDAPGLRFASEPANGRLSAGRSASNRSESLKNCASRDNGCRQPRMLKCRRSFRAWLERAWHRLRVVGVPLFHRPWLD